MFDYTINKLYESLLYIFPFHELNDKVEYTYF